MIFLAVDSSAKTASVAVSRDGVLLGETYINVGLTHSQTLMPMIEYLLLSLGIEAKDIDVYAVTTGPGSFTGVRIGVSTVKGMAFVDNKKCVSVSTLKALAYNVQRKDCIVSCCMDARRGQVYNAVFKYDGEELVRLADDRLILAEELADELSKYDEEINFVGDGAEMCYNVMRQKFTNLKLHLVAENLRYTKATGVILEAEKMYRNNEVLSVDNLVPVYLRLSQAEREYRQRLNMKDGDKIC